MASFSCNSVGIRKLNLPEKLRRGAMPFSLHTSKNTSSDFLNSARSSFARIWRGVWSMKRTVWLACLLQCRCGWYFSRAIYKKIIKSFNQRLRWLVQMHPRALRVDAS